MFKACVVIPVYNHEQAIGAVVDSVLAQKLPCVLVDDGSSASCAGVLEKVAAATPELISLIRHPVNRGKGGAVLTGLRYAAQAGYSHAVQIDADGQHRASDIPRFIEQAAAHPRALIVGCPTYDHTVPSFRFYARYFTHVWVCINTLSLKIKDSMCGFRVYPLSSIMALDARRKLGERMSFDIEVLVRLYWDGVEIINLPTPVFYRADGISHYRGWLDNWLISRAHATLFLGMLLRMPMLIARKWNGS